MDLRKVKPSKNFIDHTSDDYRNSLDWNYLLGTEALRNQGIDQNEALRGLTPEQTNQILFQKALEEFGVYHLNKSPRKSYK
jgi:hypothetical protein